MTDLTEEYKIWIALREDLTIPLGKAITQGGHGVDMTLEAAEATPERIQLYRACNRPKITCWIKNEAAVRRAHAECVAAGLPSAFVTDAGRTVFAEPTVTVFAVGPARFSELPRFVQRLQLLREKVPETAQKD